MLLSKICPNELAVLSSSVAILLSKDNSIDDNNVLGNFLIAVGSVILIIAAQQQVFNPIPNNIK